MSTFVVWLDHEHARVFCVLGEKLQLVELNAHQQESATHARAMALDSGDQDRRARAMFKAIGDQMIDAQRILILGPGLAKHLFLGHLSEHSPRLFKKVKGCETVNHLNQHQILAIVEKYFRLVPQR